MTFRLLTAVVIVAASTTACSRPPTPVQPATSAPTTTSEVPVADPTAWFEAYCGPMGVAAIASFEPQAKVAEGMAAVKEAVVRWASTAAVSDRKVADDIEKLGPLGSDVQNPHERLIKALRKEAEGFEEASGRLRALAADDVFPERYEQVMAGSGSREEVPALFKQIASTPKYAETFRTNKVCVGWQNLSKQAPGK